MKSYNTKQREILREFFEKHCDLQFTIEQLIQNLPEVSQSAVYRNISRLEEEGLVRRHAIEGSRRFAYQFVGDDKCSAHIHLKCDKCGQLFHLEDPSLENLLRTAAENFHIDKSKSVLHGSCGSCEE